MLQKIRRNSFLVSVIAFLFPMTSFPNDMVSTTAEAFSKTQTYQTFEYNVNKKIEYYSGMDKDTIAWYVGVGNAIGSGEISTRYLKSNTVRLMGIDTRADVRYNIYSKDAYLGITILTGI